MTVYRDKLNQLLALMAGCIIGLSVIVALATVLQFEGLSFPYLVELFPYSGDENMFIRTMINLGLVVVRLYVPVLVGVVLARLITLLMVKESPYLSTKS